MMFPGPQISVTLCVAILALSSQPAAGRTSGKVSSTLFVDTRGKVHVRTVARALERALSEVQTTSFTPIRHLLEPVGPELDRLARANKLVTQGRELIKNLEVEKAIVAFRQAAKLQRSVFHLLSATQSGIDEHGALYVDLAIARFLAGDESKARKNLHKALVLNPRLEFDKQRFPPQMKRAFDEVRFLVDELGSGDAVIKTDPSGVAVRVNGNFVGFSPVRARGLASGPNMFTLSKPGYHTWTTRATVQGGKQPTVVTRQLKQIPGVAARLLSAAAEAEARAPADALPSLARQVGQQVLFVATTASRDDLVTVKLYAYDARHNRISSAAAATISALDPDRECTDLVDSLVPFVLSPPKRKVAKSGKGWWERLQTSSYFWPVVGAVVGVAVVGTAVGVGVYYGARGGDNRGRNVVILPAVGAF